MRIACYTSIQEEIERRVLRNDPLRYNHSFFRKWRNEIDQKQINVPTIQNLKKSHRTKQDLFKMRLELYAHEALESRKYAIAETIANAVQCSNAAFIILSYLPSWSNDEFVKKWVQSVYGPNERRYNYHREFC